MTENEGYLKNWTITTIQKLINIVINLKLKKMHYSKDEFGSTLKNPVFATANSNDRDGKHFTQQERLLIDLGIDSGKSYTYLHNVLNRSIKSIERQYLKGKKINYKHNKNRVSVHKKTIEAIMGYLLVYEIAN